MDGVYEKVFEQWTAEKNRNPHLADEIINVGSRGIKHRRYDVE